MKAKDGTEVPIYAHSAPIIGHGLGKGFLVRVIVEPATDRSLTNDEVSTLEALFPQDNPRSWGDALPVAKPTAAPKRQAKKAPSRPKRKAAKRTARR